MADDPRDTTESAAHDATLASAFFDKLIAEGKPEHIAAQLTSAYILGRLRREKRREAWEDPD